MGRYENGNYARDNGDGELQWLEDGIGLLVGVALTGISLIVVGVFGLISGLFNLLFGSDSN